MTPEPTRLVAFLLVALGGGVGAAARFAVYQVVDASRFPWPTLAANLIGCLCIGALAPLLIQRPAAWLLVATGLLGGFTTFSSFGLDALSLLNAGRTHAALAYLALSVGGGLGLCALGFWASTRAMH